MSHLVSRLGSAMVAFVLAAGLVAGSAQLEVSAASSTSRTAVRCATRHHVRHCVRVVRHTVIRTVSTSAASNGLVAQELALVNADRRTAGLPSLTESAVLDRIATARARDMVTTGYFGHYRPGDRTLAELELLRANAVSFAWYGENIIWESGQPTASVADHFNTWWMNSPEHRANILNTHYGHIGIGVVTIGSRVYMVEDFTN